MPAPTSASLDMRGRTITTFIAYQAAQQLSSVAEGDTLELLTGFALAAALEGAEVWLYFQGPAVRVLAKGFTEKLHGPGRPFSRFARAGLARSGHIPAAEKISQLRVLGARIYACGPSMKHFKVARSDLAFDGVTIAEYLTFAQVMARADIHVFVQ
jgi:predicted peroxiredoxin